MVCVVRLPYRLCLLDLSAHTSTHEQAKLLNLLLGLDSRNDERIRDLLVGVCVCEASIIVVLLLLLLLCVRRCYWCHRPPLLFGIPPLSSPHLFTPVSVVARLG